LLQPPPKVVVQAPFVVIHKDAGSDVHGVP
jgi:hypothetical protein